MSQPNPYAPPSLQADSPNMGPGLLSGYANGLRREGDVVVIPAFGASFPHRCVVCNQPAVKRMQRKLFWHPPGYYLLIFVGALIYVIVAMAVRKRSEFELALCEAHVKRRRNGLLLAWLGTPLALIGLIALGGRSPVLMILFAVLMIAAPIAGAFMAQVISAKRIDKVEARLKVGQPFLESIEY